MGLAVSGGPDSLALLALAHTALPGRVEAATVDHRLRAESATEAEAVAAICAGLGVPQAVLSVDLAEGNLQAETLLLRLNRASGVAGLAGVRAVGQVPGTRLPLVRPLLDWRRSELADVASAMGWTAAADPSNADDRFDRARLRKAMVGADWLDVPALAASAAHLADADAALNWAAAREWSECVTRGALGLIYRPSAPRAVALRVLARIVSELDGSEPREFVPIAMWKLQPCS